MAFNIKDPGTHELARELANITGESMAKTVDTALRERKARLERSGVAERLQAIAAKAEQDIPPGAMLSTDDLYDEKGLPK